MRFLKTMFAASIAMLMVAAPLPALAAGGQTTLFSPTKGDVNFPFLPATTNPAAPATIDNTIIGSGTPAQATFTNILTSGTAPAPTGTGTPTIASGSTDTAGEVTAGTSATSVVITFANTHANAPFCSVDTQTGPLTTFGYALSATAITVTQTATTGNKIDYVCVFH